MITLHTLERVVPLLDRLKTLEASIAALSDAADVCANSRTAVKLRVDITDLDAKEAAESRVVIDSEGEMRTAKGVQAYALSLSHPFDHSAFAKSIADLNSIVRDNKSAHTTTLEQSLSEYDTLHVIGVLLQIRRAERAEIMNALKELGCE